MIRSIAALVFAGCATLQIWAQTPPAAQPTTPAAASPAPADSSAPKVQPEPKPVPVDFPLNKFREFSAIEDGGYFPGMEDEIHIYRSGDLMRMEAHQGKSYQITDLVKHNTHGVTSIGCLFYPGPYVRTFPFTYSNPANKYESVPEGTETVDGHSCKVEDIIVTIPNKPQIRFRLWEAEDLGGFPVKVQTRSGPVRRDIVFKNIDLGPQDPTLFIFPDMCQDTDKTIGTRKVPMAAPKGAPTAKPPQ